MSALRPAGTCDRCGHEGADVRSVGRDADGEPDAPDWCEACRDEFAPVVGRA